MAETTKIAWADATLNFWWGCDEVSPACANCYARELSERFGRAKWGKDEPRLWIDSVGETLAKIARRAWREARRLRVFVNSMSDFFDAAVDATWRRKAWDYIRAFPELDFLLLTKRPENIASSLPEDWGAGWAHVWIGTTAENQEWLDRRAPKLLAVPAALHWISAEPLLGHLDLTRWLGQIGESGAWTGFGLRIDWIVVGGESGSKARPFDLAWARGIIAQCRRAGVAPFVKQMGTVWARANARERGAAWSARDAGADPGFWPEDLAVQEWPASPAGAAR